MARRTGIPTHLISVRVTAAQRETLERLAKLNLSDVSKVVRDAVDSYALDCQDRGVFCCPTAAESQKTIEQ